MLDERLSKNHLYQTLVGRKEISKPPKNMPRLKNGPEF